MYWNDVCEWFLITYLFFLQFLEQLCNYWTFHQLQCDLKRLCIEMTDKLTSSFEPSKIHQEIVESIIKNLISMSQIDPKLWTLKRNNLSARILTMHYYSPNGNKDYYDYFYHLYQLSGDVKNSKLLKPFIRGMVIFKSKFLCVLKSFFTINCFIFNCFQIMENHSLRNQILTFFYLMTFLQLSLKMTKKQKNSISIQWKNPKVFSEKIKICQLKVTKKDYLGIFIQLNKYTNKKLLKEQIIPHIKQLQGPVCAWKKVPDICFKFLEIEN